MPKSDAPVNTTKKITAPKPKSVASDILVVLSTGEKESAERQN
jgi:hypothetical protein